MSASVYLGAVLSLTLFPLPIQTGDYANTVPWTQKPNLVLGVAVQVAVVGEQAVQLARG